MKPLVERIVVGALETNCYLYADPASRDAVLIDPGSDGYGIQDCIRRNGLRVQCIVNTHGHGDHISSNRKFDLPICIHRLDAPFLTNAELNMSAAFGFAIKSPPASRLLEEEDIITVGSLALRVLHTPGHTPGSISLIGDGSVFTGDTLFHGSVGRTDFPYGSDADLMHSIHHKLFLLDNDTVIYPGHGPSSTIGRERHENKFTGIAIL